jgi:hypothetical protein
MKFKSIFILFNTILFFFIVLFCFSSVYILGTEVALLFWRSNWYLLLLLLSILAVFDIFYFTNAELYRLLEKEDWPALVHYLENKVFGRGKYSKRLVRLLANTYLVLSDSIGVMGLENKVTLAKPSLVADNALIFGTARILTKDFSGAVRFFEEKLDTVKPYLRHWIHLYFSFALLLDRKYERASTEFSRLTETSDNGIITGLSAYFLGNSIKKALREKKQVLESLADQGRARVLKDFPRQKDWNREIAKLKTEIHAAVLSRYIDAAGQWLYSES